MALAATGTCPAPFISSKKTHWPGLTMTTISQSVAKVLILISFTIACGGQTKTDSAAQGGHAGASAQPGDAGGKTDAGFCGFEDSVTFFCRACPNSCNICDGLSLDSSAVVDCIVQLRNSPPDSSAIDVYVDCTRIGQIPADNDASTTPNPNGWIIDYSVIPARLVFGSALCEQIRQMNSATIYVLQRCGLCF